MTHGLRYALHVRGQRRIVFPMKCCVIPDDINHWRAGFFRVVDIGQTVAQSWPQMCKRGRWHAGHAGIAVCRSGHHPLEQPKNATHFRIAVQSSHKMHFRGAGVGKANVHPGIHKGLYQTLGTTAVFTLWRCLI